MKKYEGIWPIDKKILSGSSLASRYAQVFAGNPWYEVSRCKQCKTYSPSKPEERRPCSNPGCSGVCIEPAYPIDETRRYIQAEFAKKGAQGYVEARVAEPSLTVEEILAFGWGFLSAPEELSQSKYKTDEMRKITLELLARVGAVFYYISEVGVDPIKQGKGIGKDITSRLANSGKRQLGVVVLRTQENSRMKNIALGLGMKPIIGLDSGIKDKENELRVLFVGGSYKRN